MSELQRLINKLCPDGVEYIRLSDIASYSKIRISADKLNKSNYISVENLLSNKAGKINAISVPQECNCIYYPVDTILIGNIRPYLRKIWISDCEGGTNGDVLPVVINDKNKMIPKFLFYVLSSENFFYYDIQNSKGSKMPRGDKTAIMNFSVPIPPVEVQREIVRILDEYSEKNEKLIKELYAEIELRKKQYNYYRDLLIKSVENSEYATLKDIATVSRGIRVVKKQLETTGNIPVYQNSMTPLGYYEKSNCKSNTTFVIGAGAAGEIGFSSVKFWAADDCYYFVCSEKILDRFLYYALLCQYTFIKLQVRKASIPRLARSVIENLKILVPTIKEQERIVKILDRFDSLCNDLTSGLPAEIKARQKQYEYYRNKLLTFKEKQ